MALSLVFIDALFVEILQPSQPNGVILSAASLPDNTFTGQAYKISLSD